MGVRFDHVLDIGRANALNLIRATTGSRCRVRRIGVVCENLARLKTSRGPLHSGWPAGVRWHMPAHEEDWMFQPPTDHPVLKSLNFFFPECTYNNNFDCVTFSYQQLAMSHSSYIMSAQLLKIRREKREHLQPLGNERADSWRSCFEFIETQNSKPLDLKGLF